MGVLVAQLFVETIPINFDLMHVFMVMADIHYFKPSMLKSIYFYEYQPLFVFLSIVVSSMSNQTQTESTPEFMVSLGRCNKA
jgi:hypothetical protein